MKITTNTNYIYLVKAFDTYNWREYFPITFATKEEADAYCDKQERYMQGGVVYSYQPILLGKYEK